MLVKSESTDCFSGSSHASRNGMSSNFTFTDCEQVWAGSSCQLDFDRARKS